MRIRVRSWPLRGAKTVERWLDDLAPTIGVLVHLVIRRLVRDPVLSVINVLVRPGDVVLDIGANRGVYTHRMAKLVGESGHVHSFEPGPKRAALVRVCKRMQNVTTHPQALSDRNGKAELHIPWKHGIRLDPLATLEMSSDSSTSLIVETARLDDLDLGRERTISFVKCDVEGHELAVIGGAQATLARDMPFLLIEIDQRLTSSPIEATFDRLQGLGYVGLALGRGSPKPLSHFDKQEEQLAHIRSNSPFDLLLSGTIDFLFVPPASVGRVESLLRVSLT